MDTWLPCGRMPQEGNHLAGPGRLAGRQSSPHDAWSVLSRKTKVNFNNSLEAKAAYQLNFIKNIYDIVPNVLTNMR